MTILPDYPWQKVSIDFLGPFNTGHYVMVLTDNYSRYPAVEVIRSTAASTVVPRLDKTFAEFGIPHTLLSDNGPPFNGHEFAAFATRLGFRHRKITPLHPIANGEAERFMRTLGKAIRTAQLDLDRPWTEAVHTFLRNYRATPHSTTGQCPATLMFQRPIQVKLPSLEQSAHPSRAGIALRNDAAKAKMKSYADSHRHARHTIISIGDTVLVRQQRRTKMDAAYNPTPYVVHAIKGSMITARCGDHYITRDISMFKVIAKQFVPNITTPEQALERLRTQVLAPSAPDYATSAPLTRSRNPSSRPPLPRRQTTTACYYDHVHTSLHR
jgi:hypothetical protein